MTVICSNPNDWAFDRREMEKRGIKYDYTTLKKKDLVLTLVWSGVLAWFVSQSIYSLMTGAHVGLPWE